MLPAPVPPQKNEPAVGAIEHDVKEVAAAPPADDVPARPLSAVLVAAVPGPVPPPPPGPSAASVPPDAPPPPPTIIKGVDVSLPE